MSYLSRNQVTDLRIPELSLVECRLRQMVPGNGQILGNTARYILDMGGKRIRPILILLASAIYGAPVRARLDIAAAAELIHAASLIHDDIIDESDLRRGKTTVNVKWGNCHSVLAGDYLFSRAFNILSDYRRTGVLKVMTEAISAMCQGELLQLERHYDPSTNPKVYLDVIASKTGSLIAACCEVGGLISPMPQREVRALREYGMNIGIAYQIVDDIGDYCLKACQSGKPPGLDLKNGIVTLPLIYLLRNKAYGPPLREALGKGQSLSGEDLGNVLEESGAISQAARTALSYVDGAISRLDAIRDCHASRKLSGLAEHFRSQCLTLA